jgi:hypothetical protein
VISGYGGRSYGWVGVEVRKVQVVVLGHRMGYFLFKLQYYKFHRIDALKNSVYICIHEYVS